MLKIHWFCMYPDPGLWKCYLHRHKQLGTKVIKLRDSFNNTLLHSYLPEFIFLNKLCCYYCFKIPVWKNIEKYKSITSNKNIEL